MNTAQLSLSLRRYPAIATRISRIHNLFHQQR
jgi:hypothetical protein